MLSEVEVAWLAGLLEGEGCFTELNSKKRRAPVVILQMTDRDVVEEVARLFGGKSVTAQTRPDRKTMFRTKVRGRPAMEIMETIRPWMRSRRTSRIDDLLRRYGLRGSLDRSSN